MSRHATDPADGHARASTGRRGHRARLPERGRRRAQAARGDPRAGRGGRRRVAVAAPQNQPIVGQIVDRDEVRDAAQSRVEVTQAVLAEFGIEAPGAVMDPDPPLALDDAVRAFEPARGAALVPLRDPLRARPARTWSSGPRALRGPGHPHPGADRRRRGPLGRHPHPRGRDPDGRQPRPDRPPEGPRRRAPAPLHDHLPALGRAQPRGGVRAPRAHARRALPRRDRRHRPADEPGAARGGRRTRSSTTGSTRS